MVYTRRKKNNNKNRTRIARKKNNKGGEAFAAGGYGCVFKPALLCANNSLRINSNTMKKSLGTVSKLLDRENAFNEMQEIEKVLLYIKKIPNNSNYFIINDQVTICEPAPLSKLDLHNYDKMCSGTKLDQMGITSANINNYLNKLNAINMLDGGKDLDKVWPELHFDDNGKSFKIFKIINTHLIGLLVNAIMKLNKAGLYHFDIKASNILLGKDENTRLIDWGTSFTFENTHTHIPQKVYNRAIFQFNVPFSVILFSTHLDKVIQKTIALYKNKAQGNDLIKLIAQDIILYSLTENGAGSHFELILEYMVIVYNKINNNNNFKKETAIKMIEDYFVDILMNYLTITTFTTTFNLTAFFKEVFLHNIDIYGFLASYIHLVIINDKSNSYLVQEIAKLFNDFCWSPTYASKPIPVKTLTNRLKKLNIQRL
jgi:serine/threonine protein kinase